MGFRSVIRLNSLRRVLRVLFVLVVISGASVLVARLEFTPPRVADDGWQVTRRVERAAVAERLDEARPIRQDRRRTSDHAGSMLESTVCIRLRPLLVGEAMPGLLQAAITWEDEGVQTWLNPAAPGLDGVVTFYVQGSEAADRQGRITIATSIGALLAAGESRLLFGVQEDQIGSEQISVVDRSNREATIDLGEVAFARPVLLGTLQFTSPRTSPYNVALDLDDGGLSTSSFGGSRPLRTHRTVGPGDRELRFMTFAPPTGWSVVVPGPEGHKPFRHTGKVGDVVAVEFEERSGIRGVVDLVKYPRAARVVISSTSHPLIASPLAVSEYRAHEADAKRLVVLPLPGRRSGMKEYPLGHVKLKDGSYWVELWSLRGGRTDPGMREKRERLTFRRVVVSGGTVDVRL